MASAAAEVRRLAERLGRRVQIMEVCGTHTVSIFRSGLRSLLPGNLRLVSGPGCPVCVTAQRHIDAGLDLAARPGVTIATYGDMLRVPGRKGSLERLRANGADVRVVNSVRTALEIARQSPARQVVFLGVGFETTAPATAVAVLEAERQEIGNFSVLMCHKRVVPAMLALLQAGDVPLDGFLCPGHVSVVIGADAYRPIVDRYRRPCVIAGFEPLPIVRALTALLQQLVDRRAEVENAYPGVVRPDGNPTALKVLAEVCVVADAPWRKLGVIADSGLELAPRFHGFDAVRRFRLVIGEDEDHPGCLCGQVIQGKAEPAACPLFATACTPTDPIGPCMVSSEGTCAAWYKYHRAAAQMDQSPERR